ncbi:hypothetical protein C1646_760525 [Rhizophagus diaphanus]|nr:hypothetical protein C1646_760525 [Rhizophagus diaphanus] [Rhizophagus sp. MUCL 43196]
MGKIKFGIKKYKVKNFKWSYRHDGSDARSEITGFKELSSNITKIDIILLDYIKDGFIESNGANSLIDWKETFGLINNEIMILRNITNRKDAGIRMWHIKNFFKFYQLMKYYGKEEFNKNNIKMNIFKSSITKVLLDQPESIATDDQCKEFEEKLLDIASSRSFIMITEGIIRELTKGLVNEKWLTCFKNKNERRLTHMILNEDMKRKKTRINEGDERIHDLEKLENQKKLGYSFGVVVEQILSILWIDNGPVTMLTTIHKINNGLNNHIICEHQHPRIYATNSATVRVFGDNSKKELLIPKVIDDYNHFMGDTSIINSYLIHKIRHKKKANHKNFRVSIILDLIKEALIDQQTIKETS